MKKVFICIGVIFCSISILSCASSGAIKSTEDKLAGYTLKDKKELMEQKILHKKSKTVLATP